MYPQVNKLGASRNLGALFSGGIKNLEQRTHKLGAAKNMVPFSSGKHNLDQRTHKLGASKKCSFFV